MNFRGHAMGGVAAAALTLWISDYGQVAKAASLLEPEAWHQPFQGELGRILGMLSICFGMAFFPDLDTHSLSQRWYYRVALVILCVLYWFEQTHLVFMLAFFSFLPLLHQHRGWTHWWSTPWLVSLLLAVFYEYHLAQTRWLGGFSFHRALEFALHYWFFLMAAALGHYSHLFLDSKWIRWLGFSSNPRQHH